VSVDERFTYPSVEDCELLRMLSVGAQDEEVARELGISVRTVRRRLAELMTGIDARSRFQAGFQVATREWLGSERSRESHRQRG
jgi:DNA-binding NarL/FixJ family response regulator